MPAMTELPEMREYEKELRLARLTRKLDQGSRRAEFAVRLMPAYLSSGEVSSRAAKLAVEAADHLIRALREREDRDAVA